ncbi:hypothetical protein D1007_20837 [Hordeum vulgare]|nr:hypothetical protein D1007_20837 [Hordeum vulgare]
MTTATPGGDDVAGRYGDLPGLGVDDHVGLAVEDGGSSGDDEDLEEEAPVSMEHRVKMAEIWVANPRSSHHWTSGAGGGVILNDDVWELRIHFDSQPNLDMKLCSSDVTFLNLYAVLQTQGFYLSDELYHMRNLGIGEDREQGLDLIDTNMKLQELKKEYKHSLVLNLLVRATTIYLAASAPTEHDKLAPIVYQPPVLYDLSEPAVLCVDPQGVVKPTAFCTQESINFRKVNLEEEPLFEQSHNSSDAYESDNNSDNSSHLGEDEEDVDQSEESDENSDEELLHYEGDTDVEDLFEQEDEDVFGREEPPMQKSPKRRKKLQVRKGPTTRSHSSVLEEVIPDFIPSADEEDDWLLFEDDDDGHEPPSFVLPKGRKSRAKKRKARIWYNDTLEHPHQQLCLYMCFKDQHQFREALLSLHITQARDFRYHRNSDQRIIACCKQDHCQFCIVAAVTKGEKTFAIKKMRLENTCPTITEWSSTCIKEHSAVQHYNMH